MLNRQQAIIWTNGGLVYWRIYASLGCVVCVWVTWAFYINVSLPCETLKYTQYIKYILYIVSDFCILSPSSLLRIVIDACLSKGWLLFIVKVIKDDFLESSFLYMFSVYTQYPHNEPTNRSMRLTKACTQVNCVFSRILCLIPRSPNSHY